MTRIQKRRGTAAEWADANPVLAEGEEGYESDTGRTKIGNGEDQWADLAYDGNPADWTVPSYAALLTDTAVDSLAVGGMVHVHGGATYEVQASGATIASVAAHVPRTAYDGVQTLGTGYHVITDGGTKLRSVSSYACPTHFGAVGNKVHDDTAATQMACLYAADCGEFRPRAGTYLISDEIVYFGRVNHVGSNLVQFYAANSADLDAVFVPFTWNSSSQVDMQAKQFEKFRPVFDGIEIHCNGDNSGAKRGIILTSTEGRVEDCWIYKATEYAILVTPFNKLGDTLDDGYNLIQNWISRNRLLESGKGGVQVLDSLTQTTDGWLVDNAILGGSEWGISIEKSQGWKVLGNQVSGVLSGIFCGTPNNMVVADNVIHGFGNKTTVGPRYGIQLGGLSMDDAKAKVANNTISGEGNTTALADSSTYYYGVTFQGSNNASVYAHVNITGNAMTFTDSNSSDGFAGTSSKIRAIYQTTSTNNDIFGLIEGNSFMSDENATGRAGAIGSLIGASCVFLHVDTRVRVGLNTNCGQPINGYTSQAATASTPDIDTDKCNRFHIYALAGNIASMTTDLTGSPTDGQLLDIWFTDTNTGTQHTITWGASFTGTLLDRTDGAGGTSLQRLMYNARLAKWVGYGGNSPLPGSAAPEGSVTAPPGTLYTRTTGGVGTSLYVKESGVGNTGWQALGKAPHAGTGTPEGSLTAPVGDLYTRTDGGVGSTLYVKELGAGNTGWSAKVAINPPADYNDLLGWTLDPAVVATSQILTAATQYFCRIPLRAPTTVTNILLRLAVAGASLTHSYVALYSSAGTLLSQSVDQSADWAGSAANRTIALPAPVTVTPTVANDFVWASFYVGTAGTAPTFTRGTNNGQVNIGASSSRLRYGTIAVADTATLADITPSAMTAAVNAFVVGLS